MPLKRSKPSKLKSASKKPKQPVNNSNARKTAKVKRKQAKAGSTMPQGRSVAPKAVKAVLGSGAAEPRSQQLKLAQKAVRHKPGSKAYAQKMQQLGLVEPAPFSVDSKAFLKTQKEWYAKLRKQGFEDIEWAESKHKNAADSSYLKDHSIRKAAKGHVELSEAMEHYRIFQNFTTHAKLSAESRLLANSYCEGLSYRKMVKLLKRKLRLSVSLFYVFLRIKALKVECIEWNKTHPEGLLLGNKDARLELRTYSSKGQRGPRAPKLKPGNA